MSTDHNTPDSKALGLTFKGQLMGLLESMKEWEQLSALDKEDAIGCFMDALGALFLAYFQHHEDESRECAAAHRDALAQAARLIDLFYVYPLWNRLVKQSEWDDLWEVACRGRTNMEAFHGLCRELDVRLDDAGVIAYMEERRGCERLARERIPKEAPASHWWWFTDYEM